VKFLIVTTPRRLQVPPPALMQAAKAWIGGKLADRTFDCCYGFMTGGGVSICNADSPESMLKLLLSYPAYGFADWKVDALCDIDAALDQVIAMVSKAGG
jgi:hypothetical protein